MNILPIIFLVPFMLFALLFSYDIIINEQGIRGYLYESKCDMEIPKDLQIVYSEKHKKYAVKIKGTSDFLYHGKYGIENYHDIAKSTFYDSCHAKGFIYEYLNPPKPEHGDYH